MRADADGLWDRPHGGHAGGRPVAADLLIVQTGYPRGAAWGWLADNHRMVRRRVRIAGVVQGVGFRPYVYGLATGLELSGAVANGTGGVVLEIEGEGARVEEFLRRLPMEIPPLAQIESVAVEEMETRGEVGFRIVASDARGQVSTQIPADAATCAECLREMVDVGNRRYRYPFINCTHCGPRFTITRSIPYDRPQTSMARFAMCAACQAEYDDPRDRRFHAQPNACWECGPQLTLLDAEGATSGAEEPVSAAVALLRAGKIVAVKGIGGFHLVVDATNQEAVERLRERKHRFGKPLAVMVRDMEAVRRLCSVSDAEAALLTSAERPIVLLRALASHGLAAEVAPGVPWLGVFLPYAPVHHLLLREGGLGALVMTSANLSEEPIVIANDEAVERLRGIADAFLVHDREILQRADDSVMEIVEGRPQFVRRSRGHVPMPVRLLQETPPLLAVGGHLKSVFTLASGLHAYQSQHLGDLESVSSLEFFAEALKYFEGIFQVAPEYVVHDLHPGYASTAWALRQTQPKIAVQHHHAHIAGCMAEHGLRGPVIGLALDGTGYGVDGRVWGGEVLIATLTDFERFAHLKYVAMPGSEAAVRQPWRMAFAHLYAALGERVWDAEVLARLKVREGDARVLMRMIERGVNSPLTSSCGRMFDAAAALILGRDRVDYEAQAAIELEGVAEVDAAGTARGYVFSVGDGQGEGPVILDPKPMWEELLEDLRKGVGRATMSARFHVGVADAYVRAAMLARAMSDIRAVCLSGGVFHNRLLTRILCRRLREAGMEVYLPLRVSPGDGGLSYGQAVVAAARIAGGGS
jgi:hydrogenase maturation protein HypF